MRFAREVVLLTLLALFGCAGPSESAKLLPTNEPGLLVLRAFITTTGKAEKITILKSSGDSEQDASAKDAVSQWTFKPALNADKQPIAEWVRIPIKFEQGNAGRADK